MLLGADKRAAAEFSFFLAIPTMLGAFAYYFYKNRADMSADYLGLIAIGFAVSFVTAIIVVKTFLNQSPATASRCSRGGASSSARSAWSRWRSGK